MDSVKLSVRSENAIRNFYDRKIGDIDKETATEFVLAGGLKRKDLGIGKLAVREIEEFVGYAGMPKLPASKKPIKPSKQATIDALVAELETVRSFMAYKQLGAFVDRIDAALALARGGK